MKGIDHSNHYEIVLSKIWLHESGKTASIYGAVPWVNDDEVVNWKMLNVGYTVMNKKSGIVGIGRKPWATLEEAENWLYGRDTVEA